MASLGIHGYSVDKGIEWLDIHSSLFFCLEQELEIEFSNYVQLVHIHTHTHTCSLSLVSSLSIPVQRNPLNFSHLVCGSNHLGQFHNTLVLHVHNHRLIWHTGLVASIGINFKRHSSAVSRRKHFRHFGNNFIR